VVRLSIGSFAGGKSRNEDVREHFNYGFGIHHAGMLRPDRPLH
jgi:replicative superfamily II helicase